MFVFAQTDAAPPAPAPTSGFAGSERCTSCHAAEFELWRGSHHDLAMTRPTDETVLGDFDEAELTAHGVRSRFFRQGDDWFVRADGPDGALRDYRIAYTFGWQPLQQYLIAFPDGRLQALGLAWDSRPAAEGGQRWFHLYPDEPAMGPEHPLHWTSREQTWNYQCADCHSTGLEKGYDLERDAYATTWAEIDVACEACHGPASAHVAQATAAAAGDANAWTRDKGLAVALGETAEVRWLVDPETGLPRRSPPRTSHAETELCARCHSRRGQIHAEQVPGSPLGDRYQLALLDPGLYHADGQILDEVFVHGSFLQSRMYAAGVTCSDCHEPHSLSLKRDGDEVCAQCHPAARYASPEHHHHPTESDGASCIGCHMPQRDYMRIDARADHSLRIPRPDLSIKIGTPNACNTCHRDKTARWALDAVTEWYGTASSRRPHYGEALAAGRDQAVEARSVLVALAQDAAMPGIARATAIERLQPLLQPEQIAGLPALLTDADALVRQAALGWLDVTDAQLRYRLGMPLLEDPIRSVRLTAARVLAPLARYELPDSERLRLDAALDAYRDAQLVNAERPESHLNIGLAEMAQGKVAMARKAYRQALALDPTFAPAYTNLTDLFRALGSDAEAEATLRAGLAAVPEQAALTHSLGLLHIRQHRTQQALTALRRAATLAPENARYAYVYALALEAEGKLDEALKILAAAHLEAPADRDILVALMTISQDAGNRPAAMEFARRLKQRWPDDPQMEALIGELGL
ncbi:MAG: tetratricopeptide repeat protein [Gammaproteobacteria bacterium]|nr:tetratricopeptide repeat protein [Gammaproteobacteria bacterium]